MSLLLPAGVEPDRATHVTQSPAGKSPWAVGVAGVAVEVVKMVVKRVKKIMVAGCRSRAAAVHCSQPAGLIGWWAAAEPQCQMGGACGWCCGVGRSL